MVLGTLALLAGLLLGSAAGVTKASDKKEVDDLKQKLIDEGISASDADAIVGQYDRGTWSLFNSDTWFGNHGLDEKAYDRAYQDYLTWKDKISAMPDYVDEETINALADSKIDSENAQIQALYDQMLGRSTDLYNTEMTNMNSSYNDYVSQLLSNQTQSTNAIAGSTRSELQRSQRNAINRGATAAMRLVSNINTELGLQNKAAQQSLDTSNNLAQMLLTQRQSAEQLRSQYASDLNTHAANTANLLSGTAERKASYRNTMRDEAYSNYDNKMDRWNDTLDSYAGDSPWGSVARNNAIRNRTNSKSTL